MRRIELDSGLERKESDGFAYPLGVYPVEPVRSRPGYVVEFETADGSNGIGGSEEWEEWPDRFMYDCLVPSNRVRSLMTLLTALLPSRVYPILDVLGNDAFREIDPFIAYDLVGFDRYCEGLAMFGEWLYEDGMVGFGAMSLEPFLYVFVDEHKIVTIRCELAVKAKVEKVLTAFDLGEMEQLSGADSVEHEHRGVLHVDEKNDDLLAPEDVVGLLRDMWRLQLNIDADANIDEEGNELGVTGWYCLARCTRESDEQTRYAELLLAAGSLTEAEQLATDALSPEMGGDDSWVDVELIRSDRMSAQDYADLTGITGADDLLRSARVDALRWEKAEKWTPRRG
jgi:hypothetical protein